MAQSSKEKKKKDRYASQYFAYIEPDSDPILINVNPELHQGQGYGSGNVILLFCPILSTAGF